MSSTTPATALVSSSTSSTSASSKHPPHETVPDLEFASLPPERERSAHPETFNLDIISFLIGPFAGLVALTLSWLGFPPLFILATCCLITWLFVYRQDLSAEFFVRILFSFTTNTFFRELKSSNEHRIPAKGPVVFVCAPHANQFLDPAVIMEFVKRPVSFLIAAKSYRQGLVGALARAQRSIPVERPQDLATPCRGTISISDLKVTGKDTKFTEDFAPTDSLLVCNSVVHIASIDSDTEMTLKEHPEGGPTPDTQYKYKRVPKVNQNQVYKYVWKALADGHCVGIFPEGGSHDRTELLPLKAGVALMALGAAANYPGLDVKIITVGLNYFHGHRFRGRVFVEFGDPFSLPPKLVEQFRHGGQEKVAACNSLLETIRDQLRAVTVSSPSWDELQLLWAVRRLYQPTGVRLPPKMNMVLTRRFSEGYERLKDRPEVIQIVKDVNAYNSRLRDYGLRDHQVNITNYSRLYALWKLISRITRLILIAVFAIPGTILNAPIAITTRLISKRKASEALKASNVKVAARDVLASWKVITSMMILPLVFIVYPTIAAVVGYLAHGNPLATWGNFAVLQPLMMWASVRATETWVSIYRSLRPLVLAVFDKTGGDVKELRTQRHQLKVRLRKLVDELGPEIYGEEFKLLRLFGPEVFRQQSRRTGAATTAARSLRRMGLEFTGLSSNGGESRKKTSQLHDTLSEEFAKSFGEMEDDNDLVQSLSYRESAEDFNEQEDDNVRQRLVEHGDKSDTIREEVDKKTQKQSHRGLLSHEEALMLSEKTMRDEEHLYSRDVSVGELDFSEAQSDTCGSPGLETEGDDDETREFTGSPLSFTSSRSSRSSSQPASPATTPDARSLEKMQSMQKQFDRIAQHFEKDFVLPEAYRDAISGLGPISLSDIGGIASDLSNPSTASSTSNVSPSEHYSDLENETLISNTISNSFSAPVRGDREEDKTLTTDLQKLQDDVENIVESVEDVSEGSSLDTQTEKTDTGPETTSTETDEHNETPNDEEFEVVPRQTDEQ